MKGKKERKNEVTDKEKKDEKSEEPEKDVKTSKEKDNKESTSTKAFFFMAFAILVIIALIFAIKLIPQETQKSLDEALAETMTGEQTDEQYNYNGFGFVKRDGLWWTQLKDTRTNEVFDLPLHYGPKELENFTVDGAVRKYLKYITDEFPYVYITFDPDGDDLNYIMLANSELQISMRQVLAVKPIIACSHNNSEACIDVPIKNCRNTLNPVVFLAQTETSGIFMNGNCINLAGKQMELMKAVDKLLYIWYDIMEE